MKISFVILTWNSELYIEKCLRSILDYTGDIFKPYEIFIVDNGSEDATLNILYRFKQIHPTTFNIIPLPQNNGTTVSRNIALKKAIGDYIVILDSDIIVGANYLEPLIREINRNPKTGLVVPKLVFNNGAYQKSTDLFPTLISKLKRYLFLRDIEKSESAINSGCTQIVDTAIAAFWLIKREVMGKVGGFDEAIFYSPEDVDYCLRLWKSGYEILYVPESAVVHNAQEISRKTIFSKSFLWHCKGLAYYFIKHKYFLSRPKYGLYKV